MQLPGLLAPNLDMTYHGLGHTERCRAGGTNFHDDFLGVAVIQEGLLSNAFVTRDNFGNLISLRRGNASQYYVFDGLGSVVALTDSAGNVVNRYAYDPYGNRIASGTSEGVANPFQFAGGYRDTTGFYKFGARYYEPGLGRWTQRDPSGADANPYAYAGDNPVNLVDPSGLGFCPLREQEDGGCVGGSLVPSGVDEKVAGATLGWFTTGTCVTGALAASAATGGTSIGLAAAGACRAAGLAAEYGFYAVTPQ